MKQLVIIGAGVLLLVLFLACGCDLFHVCTFDQKVVESVFLAEDATCDDAPCYYYSCKCGKSDTRTFYYGKPLGHKYDNLLCSVCGFANPGISELLTAESASSITLSFEEFRRFFYSIDLYSQPFSITLQDKTINMNDLKFELYSTYEDNELSDRIACMIDTNSSTIESTEDLDGTYYFLISIPESINQFTANIS